MSLLRQWRYLLITLLAVVALVAVAACGDDDDDGDEATDTPAASETDAPVAGGEITVHTTEPACVSAMRCKQRSMPGIRSRFPHHMTQKPTSSF